MACRAKRPNPLPVSGDTKELVAKYFSTALHNPERREIWERAPTCTRVVPDEVPLSLFETQESKFTGKSEAKLCWM